MGGFRPQLRRPNAAMRMYDPAAPVATGYLAQLDQVDTAAFMHSELTSHELLDHGPVHRVTNLPPLQNFEALGPQTAFNNASDLAYLASGGNR